MADLPPITDVPPRRKPRSGPPLVPLSEIKESLYTLFGIVGATTMGAGDAHCGMVLVQRGPLFVDALIELAEKDKRVRRALSTLTTASGWGSVIIAGAGIILPVAAHHGLLPAVFQIPDGQKVDSAADIHGTTPTPNPNGPTDVDLAGTFGSVDLAPR